MELNFVLRDGLYEAEFKAENDFNLHVERAVAGSLYFYQKSVENGKYDLINKMQGNNSDLIVDADMTALIYPKWIKIVSVSKPTMAIVTSESDITIITPKIKFSVGDANFEVEAGTTWADFIDNEEPIISHNGTEVEIKSSDFDGRIVYGYTANYPYSTTEFPSGYVMIDGQYAVPGEIKAGHYELVGVSCSFSVDDLQVTCDQYMTWSAFYNSSFNGQVLTVKYVLSGVTILNENGKTAQLKSENGNYIYENDLIINGATYTGFKIDETDANTMTIDGVEYNFSLGDDWNSWMSSSNSKGEYRDYFIDDTGENRVMHNTRYAYVTDDSGRYVVVDDKIIKGHAYKLK